MRMIKTEEEIQTMQLAADITSDNVFRYKRNVN
jgi:Xaa-Pro aminopeptidase